MGAEDTEWYIYLIIILLSLTSALSNGMNIGLMGMDLRYLELMTKGPFLTKKEEKEAYYARKILPLRTKGNQMLTTILLMTVLSNTLISILMADIEGDLSGFLISTTIVVLFGEIVPQSLCNKFALPIGTYVRFLMYFFFYGLFIVTYPVAAILDKVLGEEEAGNVLTKSRMKKLFHHYEKQQLLKPSERKMLSAALELKEKAAGEVMTPLSKVFMLDINQNLDEDLKRTIYSKGYSRIPIYDGERENIVGILQSRDLILTNIDNSLFTIKQLSSILVREVIAIDSGTKLEPLLVFFKRGESQMAIVTQVEQGLGKDPVLKKVGIITLEDIIEEILCEEIEDEREVDEMKGERKRMKEKLILLFSDRHASQVLNKAELVAICEYLQQEVTPFQPNRIQKEVLQELIGMSDVIDNSFFYHADQTSNLKGNIVDDDYVNQEQLNFQTVLQKLKANEKAQNQKKKVKEMSKQKTEDINQEMLAVKPLTFTMTRIDENKTSPYKKESNTDLKPQESDGDFMDIPEEEQLMELKKLKEQKKRKEILSTDQNPILYIRNVPSKDFYLILHGTVSISSGQEGFIVDLGPFNFIGVNALLKEDEYLPDFTAKVVNKARLLKITRDDYQLAISNIKNVNRQ